MGGSGANGLIKHGKIHEEYKSSTLHYDINVVLGLKSPANMIVLSFIGFVE